MLRVTPQIAHRRLAGMDQELVIAAHAFAGPLAGEPPEWVELMPVGQVTFADGRKPITLKDAAAVIERSMAEAAGNILPIDIDHGADRKGGSSEAAGWITELEVRDGAVWGRVEWTEKGHNLVAGKAYRFLSPNWWQTKSARPVVTRIGGAALVNVPALPQLKALASRKDTTMDREQQIAIAKALGLDETASPEEMATAAAAHVQEADQANARLARIAAGAGVDGDVDDAAEQKIVAAFGGSDPDPAKYVPIGSLTELQKEVAALKKADTDRTADQLVASAKREGKLPPSLEGWAKDYAARDPEGFGTWAKDQPVVAPPGRELETTPARQAKGELSGQEKDIAAACGVSSDAFKKTREEIEAATAARQ